MRCPSFLLAVLVLQGCAAFGVHSEAERAEANLLATHTLHDYEIARAASSSLLASLEGAFQLAPDDEDLMILLADAWVSHAELFLIDSYETALIAGGDSGYERERVQTGFERARHWGLTWFSARVPDLDAASLGEASLKAALDENFDDPEDATALLVLGHAFLGSAMYLDPAPRLPDSGATRDSPGKRGAGSKLREQRARLGAMFLEHSILLDPGTRLGSAHGLLGVYYASVRDEAARASKYFQRAAVLGQGKYSLTELRRAVALHCAGGNRDAFESDLNEVLETGDPLPEVRLHNAVAKRRASRWLVESSLRSRCPFERTQARQPEPPQQN